MGEYGYRKSWLLAALVGEYQWNCSYVACFKEDFLCLGMAVVVKFNDASEVMIEGVVLKD